MKKFYLFTFLPIIASIFYVADSFANYVENPDYKEFYIDWNGYTTTEDPWRSRQFIYDSNYIRATYDEDTSILKVS